MVVFVLPRVELLSGFQLELGFRNALVAGRSVAAAGPHLESDKEHSDQASKDGFNWRLATSNHDEDHP